MFSHDDLFSLDFLVANRDTFVNCMSSICRACRSSGISNSVKLLPGPCSK